MSHVGVLITWVSNSQVWMLTFAINNGNGCRTCHRWSLRFWLNTLSDDESALNINKATYIHNNPTLGPIHICLKKPHPVNTGYRVFHGNLDKLQEIVHWVKTRKKTQLWSKIVCLKNTAKNLILLVFCVFEAFYGLWG